MRILLWHVHGSWTTAFVQGPHTYLLPVTPARDADGLGRARTWDWPASVVEVPVDALTTTDVDLVLLQRPHELELAERWLGRRPGRDVPAVYVEHNTPLHGQPDVPDTRHPLAGQTAVPVVHVTHFNDLFWECDGAPTHVIEHGVVDPGHRWTGELSRAAVVVNDPVRRGRSVGADLLPTLTRRVPVDLFGMRVEGMAHPAEAGGHDLVTHEDLPQEQMHSELARRGVYVHTSRWTSLGLSLIEAMHLGMPVVALATTEAPAAVPPEAGVLTTSRTGLAEAAAHFLHDREAAASAGKAAREHALAHFGLGRFLTDWNRLLAAQVGVPAADDEGRPTPAGRRP